MDFGKIISRAWRIVKSRRYLWYLGILAFLTEGGFLMAGLPGPQPLFQYTNRASYNGAGGPVEGAGAIGGVLGAADSREFGQFLLESLPAIAAVLAGIALFLILLIYLANACRAGLILSVNRLEDKGAEESCLSVFRAGRKFSWRLFGLDLLINLLVLLAILAVSSPLVIALSFKAGIAAYILTGLVVFAGLFAVIILSVFLGIAGKWASREVVAGNKRVIESFARGRQLARLKLKESVIAWLIDLCFWVVLSTVLIIVWLFAGVVLFGFGFLLGMASVPVAVFYGIVIALVLFAAVAVFNGACTSFISSFWTLAWRALGHTEADDR